MTAPAPSFEKLSDVAFAALGTPRMAYVKPVAEGEVMRFEVHGADGSMMGVLEDEQVAVATILQYDMVPVSIH